MVKHKELLDTLAQNDGAVLYWHLDHRILLPALMDNAVKHIGSLIVHPDAVELKCGTSYTMPKAKLNIVVEITESPLEPHDSVWIRADVWNGELYKKTGDLDHVIEGTRDQVISTLSQLLSARVP